MKAPDHPLPSGDRQIARLLVTALSLAGHTVEGACTFRSYEATGDPRRQARLAGIGNALAQRLAARFVSRPPDQRPEIWFTYHLYHKAPDWLGPTVCRRLEIPYVVCEASYAPKQATGPWAAGLRASAAAIAEADLVLSLNSDDRECVQPLLADPTRLRPFAPFIDARPFARADTDRAKARARLAQRFPALNNEMPWLVAVGMMRPGDKLASYRVLAAALAGMQDKPWRLLIAGDGPAEAEVRRAFEAMDHRVTWLGCLEAEALVTALSAADIFVWPAINEAFGIALLEAQAAGLPVVAGRTRGVPDIVADGETGLLVPVGDDAAFATAVTGLLDNAPLRQRLGERARQRILQHHDLPAAAARLDTVMRGIARPRIAAS